ncbi:MAG: LysR family transcriptional regulator [Oscillospiraceae bacterium]|nr:LysR family transcriptional regulator [Oscillospiraceae bacterium]
MEEKFRPVVSVRIFGEDKCFGPGVAQLLRLVEQKHSLRAAAASMAMAYSKAWTIIKSAEKELGFFLLVSTTGGKNGGGATLSEKAQSLLAVYEQYCNDVRTFAQREFHARFSEILEQSQTIQSLDPPSQT